MKLFINNKYTTWYYNIINNAIARPKPDCYTEKHHIIPRCLGGEDIAVLTAREHFICHWLLVKMLSGKNKSKMWNAFSRMLYRGSNVQKRYYPNSYTYKTLREKVAESRRGAGNNAFGKPGTFSGKTHSEESKKKMSDAKKKLVGDKHPWFGKTHSDETKIKQRNAKLGKKASKITKEKMKTAQKERHLNTIWITNNSITKKIKKTDNIPVGWIKGRKTKPT